LTFFH